MIGTTFSQKMQYIKAGIEADQAGLFAIARENYEKGMSEMSGKQPPPTTEVAVINQQQLLEMLRTGEQYTSRIITAPDGKKVYVDFKVTFQPIKE